MAHKHNLKGRKFHRTRDQRRALLKGLASNMIEHGQITTTHEKAKELSRYIERLITKAKKGDLHNRRLILQKVAHEASAHKLVDELAPKMGGRTSGYVRIKHSVNRRGDNASLSIISFVDDISEAPVAKAATEAKIVEKAKVAVRAKPAVKKESK
jgi:large subunit ribosomal protein L17